MLVELEAHSFEVQTLRGNKEICVTFFQLSASGTAGISTDLEICALLLENINCVQCAGAVRFQNAMLALGAKGLCCVITRIRVSFRFSPSPRPRLQFRLSRLLSARASFYSPSLSLPSQWREFSRTSLAAPSRQAPPH